MRTIRVQRHLPGFDRKSRRHEPRLSDLILAITATLMLVVGCLSIIAAATM